jgi:LemA protein
MNGLSAAKASPGDPAAMQQLSAGQGALNTALGRLFAVAEQYPDLKASQNMMQLSEELTSTENRVAFARQAYNDSVLSYNNRRQTFPGSLFADTFHFTAAAPLEIPPDHPEMRDAPKVQF